MTDNLASTFLRIRDDQSVEALPVDDRFWPRLVSGELGDFHREHLVAMHHFEGDWGTWECHPRGDEIVCLLSGSVTLVLREAGGERETTLSRCGDFACVPRGCWHTARVHAPSSMLFITPGEDTENRALDEPEQ